MREEKKGRNSFVGARTNAPRCSVDVYAGVGGNSEFVFRRLHLSWPVIHANDLRAGPPALLGTESARAGGRAPHKNGIAVAISPFPWRSSCSRLRYPSRTDDVRTIVRAAFSPLCPTRAFDGCLSWVERCGVRCGAHCLR